MLTVKGFVAELTDVQMPNVFNPYTEKCSTHDLVDGAARRRANLENFLEASIRQRVDTIWIARDLGYRGGRRTGVPLTDEVHLEFMSRLFGGFPVTRATRGPLVAERTAAIIWRAIEQINRPIFLWNIFPFHPHGPTDPMSNRCHTRTEREACLPIINRLFEMLRPKRVVAIGRDAHSGLAEMRIDADAVRHPSYGGQREFIDGVFNLYGLKRSERSWPPSLFDKSS